MAYNPITQLSMNYNPGPGLASKESFLFNIHQEGKKYIENPKNAFNRLASSLIPAGSYAALVTLTLRSLGNANAASQFMRTWATFLVISTPFFLITHDWFRYFIFTIIMSLVTTYRKASLDTCQTSNSLLAERPKLLSLALIAIGLLGLIVVGPISNDVRIHLPHDLLAYQVLIFGYLMSVNYFLFRQKSA